MGEAPDAQQRDSRVRAGEQADHAGADHQHRPHRHHQLARDDQVDLEILLEQRRQITADDAAEIGEQHRHPGEHGDLFQIKTVGLEHEQRDPGVEGAPRRFREKARQRDAPELAVAHDLPGGHLFGVRGLVLRFLAFEDVTAFFLAQFLLIFRVFVEQQPADGPDQAQHAGDDERHLPAVRDDGPYHQRRGDHAADRRAHVEIADGDRTLFGREPFAAGLQPGGDHCRFRHADRAARQRQPAPTVGQCGAHAEQRPQNGEHGVADLGAQHVQHVARHRLHHGVARGVGGDDIGILLGGDVQRIFQRRRRHGNGVAGQVTQHGADGHQSDHVPA